MKDGQKGARPGQSSPEGSPLTHDEDSWREERNKTADLIATGMRLIAIGQLAAGVAHELNNPLSVILGFSQSALRLPIENEMLRTSFKAIERESQRCKRLVQDLLNLSRLPRPGKVMENPIQIIDGALSLVEAQARIHNIDVIRHFDADLPMIHCDQHRIQQMVINLCLNGMDAMPHGGQLTVRLSRLSEAESPMTLKISVTDTGTGIPPEIRERIFEPFFTTKEQGKGTGLGLSLVHDVVKEHEGRLEVMSKLGQGTTFTIRLAAESKTRSMKPASPTNPGRVRRAGRSDS